MGRGGPCAKPPTLGYGVTMLMHIDPRHIGCREVERFLFDYVERTLDMRLLMAFDSHAVGCQHCRQMVDSYRQSNETVRRHISKVIKIPNDFRERLVESLQRTPT